MVNRILWILMAVTSAAMAQEGEEKWRLQYLNERYDDFFHHQRTQEKLEQERESHAPEATKARKEWEKLLESVRKEYVRDYKPRTEDAKAREAWFAEQRRIREEQEMARRRYVEFKNRIEAVEKRAKKIPSLKEYDLDEVEWPSESED